jgi:hypothetical protein
MFPNEYTLFVLSDKTHFFIELEYILLTTLMTTPIAFDEMEFLRNSVISGSISSYPINEKVLPKS